MKKKMNNKGFSLVELIIVIAIMAVLIGVLAPQYLKYVKESKISTDVSNAQNLASAINVAIADNSIGSVTGLPTSAAKAGGASETISNLAGVTYLPESKVNSTYPWLITYDKTNGVTKITLNSLEIYPNSSAYEDATHN